MPVNALNALQWVEKRPGDSVFPNSGKGGGKGGSGGFGGGNNKRAKGASA